MNILNQFSYPILIAAILVTTGWFLFRGLRLRLPYVALTLAAIGLVALAIFSLLRPAANSLTSAEDALRIIQNGRPTFIEFFSQYCTGCLAFRPTVDTIVTEIEDEFNVLRIDIHSGVGRDLRRRLTFSFTPEFILFDASGEEIWRDHLPPSAELVSAARP